ncbi:phosphate propanoyltransferase [Halanaerobium congolense]|uniref:Phosphate propanoyltransferase n=1 Tax=Halanaerobium congolense TaxID=54121 RepID=A0A1G6KH38_9FIRM|nr:phosphate propanoyltransferase [Halanaerobium congolense]PXV62561.1 putative phosphotransacetylase [Halanaerobium congolense]SDC30284.1 putative phosphotransacetylase [Halanaerobium congolense]
MDKNKLVKMVTNQVLDSLNTKTDSRQDYDSNKYNIPIGISVRHLHITQADLEKLYGSGYKLSKKKDLAQPGEFASNEVVTLVGPRLKSIENVRILGPVRDHTQVEVSQTDAITLGIKPPVRRSGIIKGSESLTLIGPEGAITLDEGVIRANRHIHLPPAEADKMDVKNDEIVSVEIPGTKSVVLRNVQVRVKEGWVLQMHLDTDDANAADVQCGLKARIIKE